jgi:ribonuclease BN (tRNA processing enzyme)
VRIVVLGGSAAGPNTGAGCSGYLVTEGDTSIAIDLGPGSLPELRKHVDYRSLSGIVISHYHLDHIQDLGALRYLAMYNPDPIDHKIQLHVPPDSAGRFAQWARAFADDYGQEFLETIFDITEYEPNQTLAIDSIGLQFARTVHPVPAWAIRVHGSGPGEFGYTADTGPTADLVDFFRGVTLLASEATEPADTMQASEKRGHLTPAEAGKLATNSNAKALILTHRWEELGLEGAANEAGAEFNGPIMIAKPGLTVFV